MVSGTSNGITKGSIHWEKPPEGWTKVNVDAALFDDVGSIGLGWVARDVAGQFIGVASIRYEGFVLPRVAEAMV